VKLATSGVSLKAIPPPQWGVAAFHFFLKERKIKVKFEVYDFLLKMTRVEFLLD
jgi:hypothetical protein